ncbi:hypothetical protein OAF74_02220 [bacterium]|nr:hypothetical protein [bacterium]
MSAPTPTILSESVLRHLRRSAIALPFASGFDIGVHASCTRHTAQHRHQCVLPYVVTSEHGKARNPLHRYADGFHATLYGVAAVSETRPILDCSLLQSLTQK